LPHHFCYDVGVPTFIPPTANNVAAAERGDNTIAGRLFRYVSPGKSADNVFRLTNGSFTTVQPSDVSLISRTFWGATKNYVTDAEAAELVAAGFSVSSGDFQLGSSFSSTLGGDATLGATDADRGLL
jgi:hypothetical protein